MIQKLREMRKPVVVNELDIVEMHIKGSGPGISEGKGFPVLGGQAVNKTSNAVCLLHKPTGIQVRSHKTRYLEINRRDAMNLLRLELDKIINGDSSKDNLTILRERERKRVAARKSKKKYAKADENTSRADHDGPKDD